MGKELHRRGCRRELQHPNHEGEVGDQSGKDKGELPGVEDPHIEPKEAVDGTFQGMAGFRGGEGGRKERNTLFLPPCFYQCSHWI